MTAETRSNITFIHDGHRYRDFEKEIEFTPVSNVIEEYSIPFQDVFWAVYRTLDQAGYRLIPHPKQEAITIFVNNARFKRTLPQIISMIESGRLYGNFTPEQILVNWKKNAKEACEVGSEKHDFIEDCINKFYKEKENLKDRTVVGVLDKLKESELEGGFKYRFALRKVRNLEDSPLKYANPKVFRILKAAIKAGYTLYAEVRVYSTVFGVCGTIDVFAVKGRDFFIIDWKTNKKPLKFESGYYKKVWNEDRTEKIETKEWVPKKEFFKYPINNIPYAKGNGYKIQLSLYALLAERWGYNCKGLILCHLLGVRNEGAETVVYNFQPMRKEMNLLLEHHLKKKNGVLTRGSIR